MITDDLSATKPGGVAFSEPHATTFADMDGDGIPDLIVGKRVYAHEESYNDPDPFGPAVLYWFRTVRNPKAPGGAEFVPELIHNRSGVGSTVLAVDLNKDGAMDIVTSTVRRHGHILGESPCKKGRIRCQEVTGQPTLSHLVASGCERVVSANRRLHPRPDQT